MTATTDVMRLAASAEAECLVFTTCIPAIVCSLRWFLIGTMTAIAFHESIASLVETTRGGGLGGFVWTVL